MKRLTVTLMLAFAALTAFPQAEVAIGIKAGPNFAKISANDDLDANYKNRTGFHAGAFVLFKFTKIGIQPELLFSQQGTKVEINNKDLEANYTYFNIPVMLKL